MPPNILSAIIRTALDILMGFAVATAWCADSTCRRSAIGC
jgi:hypothetical protein